MVQPPHEQRARVRDVVEAVHHSIPRDLARDVDYYLREARDPELAADVLVDGLVELRILLSRDEYDLLEAALEACGRGRDRRLRWIEEHGMKPIPAAKDDEGEIG